MRILVGLIGTASFLFIIGGFGTIVTLIVRADPDKRAVPLNQQEYAFSSREVM